MKRIIIIDEELKKLGIRLCEVVDTTKIKLTGEEDGRIESLNSEKQVTDCLREKCSEINFKPKTKNRDFGDITPTIDGKELPINIKMVDETKSSTYNGGGPTVFNYVLFGKKATSWTSLVKRIKSDKPKRCVKKYHYLIYYKNSDRKSMFCSLDEISRASIAINPSNPIQLRKDITLVKRTEKEKVDFIISLFEEVLYKRAQPYLEYIDTIA